MPKRLYNLRKRPEAVVWVDDDTMKPKKEEESDSSEDDDYEPPEDSEESEDVSMDEEDDEDKGKIINIPMPKKGMRVKIEIDNRGGIEEDEEESGSESDDEEEEEDSEEEEFIAHLMNKYAPQSSRYERSRSEHRRRRHKEDDRTPPLALTEDEMDYYESLSKSKRRKLNEEMRDLSKLVSDGEVPYKFRVLALPIPNSVKAMVIRKVDVLNEMDSDSSEVHKLKSWVDGFLRVPFGKVVPLPVDYKEDKEKCAKFLQTTQTTLDRAVYGMNGAKTQIMQTVAQWIANPDSVGNVIALKGPMGVGKTSFARHGVAEVLKRPFEFISLGGASDSSQFTGHSYTYEGATHGRIVDTLMRANCMNPVIYFDELDKVSTTAHGDEIVSMLIHLTDRGQNNQFHDKYFAGVDFDVSQCLFVFSFNDESKVHPVLKDRMQVITCSGYTAEEKKVILQQYVWPQMLERLHMEKDLTITEDAIKFMISEYSKEEEGVRIVIRATETLVTRVNLLRIADEETAKTYKFYKKIMLPMTITPDDVKHILADNDKVLNESWRHLYT